MAILWIGHTNLCYISDPPTTELLAYREALNLLSAQGFSKAIIDGDCLQLIQGLQGALVYIQIQNSVYDINCLSSQFESICFKFIKREGNKLAHVLAQNIVYLSLYFSLRSNKPILKKLLHVPGYTSVFVYQPIKNYVSWLHPWMYTP